MYLRTLGGLALEGASIRRPKPLVLLAYLCIEGPQPRRYLAELFWMGAADPRQSLSVALGQLRAGAPGVVSDDGSRLSASVDCDAVALGAALSTDGRWAEALELYRGPFLAGADVRGCGVELEEWIFGTRETLASSAQEALVAAAEAAAARDDEREATRLAARALALTSTDADPTASVTQRLHALLERGGNRSARTLAAEARALGVRWTPATERAADETRPTERKHDLPAPLTSFVGRAEERSTIAELLHGGARLVTLVGLGGVGKTRLAVEAARHLVDSGALERAVFVPLESVHDADDVPGHVVMALRHRSSAPDPWTALVAAVGHQRLLLVLDNVEQIDALPTVVATLLDACPTVRLIATSRAPLGIAAEHLLPIDGLGSPDSGSHALARSPSVDAVDLFVERARRVHPRFRLDAGNADAVVHVCRLLAGSPLGIELAASLVRAVPPDDLAAELTRDLDVLSGRGPDRPRRHASLRTIFDHAWQRLTPPQRGALGRVSVFEGGFTRRAAAEAVDVGVPLLAALVDASLVRRQDRRYEVHPLVRQYARERLSASAATEDATRARHAEYWSAFMAARAGGGRGVLAEVMPEVFNAAAAWRWAAGASRYDLLERMLPALLRVLADAGRVRELMSLIDDALTRAPSDTATYARLVAAKVECLPPDDPDAITQAEHARALLAELGDDRGLARATYVLAAATLSRGDVEAGRGLLEDALASSRRLEDGQGIVACLNGLALVTEAPDEHRHILEQAIASSRAFGDGIVVSRAIANLGVFMSMTYGAYRTEVELLDQALADELAVSARRYALASLTARRGLASLRAGDGAAAEASLQEAEALLEGQDHWEVASVRTWLAVTRALRADGDGDPSAARAALPGRPDHPLGLELLVRLALDEHDLETAERHLRAFERCRERLAGSRDRRLVDVKASLFRAEIAARRGGRAASHVLPALDVIERLCFVPAALDAFLTVARTVPSAHDGALARVAATHPAATTITRVRARALAGSDAEVAPEPAAALDADGILRLAREVASDLERTP